MNLDQWLSRCHLKKALVVISLSTAEQFQSIMGEHSYEIISNLDQLFKRCCLKISIFSSGSHFV